jgi:redox-sensitive bicupin YhaK (pirin superfamily)
MVISVSNPVPIIIVDRANYISSVLIAGQPLDQKVVQYGPFVMNSQEQVQQALLDFRSYSNGFERARGWRSEIGKDSM